MLPIPPPRSPNRRLRLPSAAAARWWLLLACASVVAGSSAADEITYTLTKGSQLVDDCPVCDRIPLVVPMTGSFRLALISSNPLFETYEFRHVELRAAGTPGGKIYSVAGSGTYRQGGEVALVQQGYLDVLINDGIDALGCRLENPVLTVPVGWPLIDLELVQTNGTPTKNYQLRLMAAPVPEVPLSVSPAGGRRLVVLRWPTNAPACQLESTATPGPAGGWVPVTNRPGRVGTNFALTLPATNVARFFRLRCP